MGPSYSPIVSPDLSLPLSVLKRGPLNFEDRNGLCTRYAFKFWLTHLWRTELRGTGERHPYNLRSVSAVKILTDDIFLEIFAFCIPNPCKFPRQHMRVWRRLVHVCRRWRQIICASPRSLDLHLYCSESSRTSFRKNISLWPQCSLILYCRIPGDEDNVIAALEHPDRVRNFFLYMSSEVEGEGVLGVMQVPFPVLTYLGISGPTPKNLPDGFLGGSAPCLQHLRLDTVSFPTLPTLLLSARNLVSLEISHMPQTGYISPDAMVRSLAVLTRLETLCFESSFSIPPHEQERRRSDTPKLSVFPALLHFQFEGDSKYLEDLVSQIDAPRCDAIIIQYHTKDVETRYLSHFIGRTENLKLAQFRDAKVIFRNDEVDIHLERPHGECKQAFLSLTISVPESNFPVPYVVRMLGQLVAILSDVGQLSIIWDYSEHHNRGGLGWPVFQSIEWLPLLRLFPAVVSMYVSQDMSTHIASLLEDVADSEEMVTKVLPKLQLLWLCDYKDDDKLVRSTEQILLICELCGHPMTIVNTEDEYFEKLKVLSPLT